MRENIKNKLGFTLLEILLLVATVFILAGIIVITINPNKQLGDIRNAQRREDVKNMFEAIYNYTSDHNGALPPAITSSNTEICHDNGDCYGLIKIASDLVPDYINVIPIDPSLDQINGSSTGYNIYKDENNQVVISAPYAENSATINLFK